MFGFVGVIVCVVGDTAFFVGLYALAFHHPVYGWLAVDDVVIGSLGMSVMVMLPL